MEEKKENEEVKETKAQETKSNEKQEQESKANEKQENKSNEKKEEQKNKVENKTSETTAKKDEETKKEEKSPNNKVETNNKKVEQKAKTYTESKESKNSGLWVLAIIAFRQKSAKETVEAMLNCLKTGDFSSTSNYTNYNDLIKTADIENEDQTMSEEAQRLLFNKLSWKIGDVKEEQDTATVEVEVTNKNFETVLNNYMQKVVKIAFGGSEPTEEEYNNYLLEELKKEDIPTTTVSKKIELKKVDGKWIVTANEELVSLLLPGLESIINTNIDG